MATTVSRPDANQLHERDSRQLDERELRAWRGMLRAHAALTKALDADLDAAHSLPLSSYEVLLYLNDAEGGRMRMRDLAASVILSRSGLTRLADRLEREGLIRRESCASDARGSYAVLTSAGAEKLAVARATHLAGVRSLFLAHFSASELDVLGDAWERVVPGAGSAPGPTCG
jgi:DNA-binding MarR family transcriptional regulator